MSGRCEDCGATTEWDQELGSAICLQCGTLADPTQSVFTSQYDYVDTSAREYSAWSNVPGGSTLRGRNGWALAGQGKEARDRKNTVCQIVQRIQVTTDVGCRYPCMSSFVLSLPASRILV